MRKEVEVQQVARINQGLSYSRYLYSSGIPHRILQVANLQGLTVSALPDDRIENMDANKVRAFVARPGQVLVALRTSSLKAAVVPEGIDHAIAANSLTILDIDPALATPEFVAVLLNSKPMQAYVAPLYAGTTIPTLSLPDFKRLKIALPSLEVQQAIVQAQHDINKQEAAFRHVIDLHAREINAYLSPMLGAPGSHA